MNSTAIRPRSVCFLSMKSDPLAHPVTVGANGRAVRLSDITTSARPGYIHGRAMVKGKRLFLLIPAAALCSLAPARI